MHCKYPEPSGANTSHSIRFHLISEVVRPPHGLHLHVVRAFGRFNLFRLRFGTSSSVFPQPPCSAPYQNYGHLHASATPVLPRALRNPQNLPLLTVSASAYEILLIFTSERTCGSFQDGYDTRATSERLKVGISPLKPVPFNFVSSRRNFP